MKGGTLSEVVTFHVRRSDVIAVAAMLDRIAALDIDAVPLMSNGERVVTAAMLIDAQGMAAVFRASLDRDMHADAVARIEALIGELAPRVHVLPAIAERLELLRAPANDVDEIGPEALAAEAEVDRAARVLTDQFRADLVSPPQGSRRRRRPKE
jgi:hypothetical protein